MKKKIINMSIVLACVFVSGLTYTALANKIPDAAKNDCKPASDKTCQTLIVTPSGNYVQTVYDAEPII